jgi:hypothetical protein
VQNFANDAAADTRRKRQKRQLGAALTMIRLASMNADSQVTPTFLPHRRRCGLDGSRGDGTAGPGLRNPIVLATFRALGAFQDYSKRHRILLTDDPAPHDIA